MFLVQPSIAGDEINKKISSLILIEEREMDQERVKGGSNCGLRGIVICREAGSTDDATMTIYAERKKEGNDG